MQTLDYGANGEIISTADAFVKYNATNTTLAAVQTYQYNASNILTGVTTDEYNLAGGIADSVQVNYSYNAAGQVQTATGYEFDANGYLVGSTSTALTYSGGLVLTSDTTYFSASGARLVKAILSSTMRQADSSMCLIRWWRRQARRI